MGQCVRCWVKVSDKRLWCDKCMERVNEELRWEANREYSYYFRFNLKRMRHENRKLSEMLKSNREEVK